MRLKARLAVALLVLFFCLAGVSQMRAQAQDAPPAKPDATRVPEVPPRFYRLEYTLTEVEGGKKIDSRQYAMTTGGGANSGRTWEGRISIGTRIPVSVKSAKNGDSEYQYIDVGTKVSSVISLRDEAQVLHTLFDFSSVAPDESKLEGVPILRNMVMEADAPILIGKPMSIGVADDPNSGRKYTLEVMVTEIK